MLLLKNTALLWKDSQRFIFSQPNGSQNFPFPERNSEGKITPNKPQRSLPIFTSYCVALPHQPLLLFPTPETVTRLHLLFQLPLQKKQANKQRALQPLLSSERCCTRLCLAPNSPEAVSAEASVLQEADTLSQRCNLLDCHLLKTTSQIFLLQEGRKEITRRNGIIWAWAVSSFHESLMPEFCTCFPLQLIEWFF